MPSIPIPQQVPIERAGWNTDFSPGSLMQMPSNDRTPVNPIDVANQQAAMQSQNNLRQAQTLNSAQDAAEKQRSFQVSMLNGVMALPPEQQADALSKVVPMMNRMGPTQFDPAMSPATAKLYLMSNVPTAQVPTYALNQQMVPMMQAVQDRLRGNVSNTGQQPTATTAGGTPMPQNGVINGNGAPVPQGGGQPIDTGTLAMLATIPGMDKAASTINSIQNESPQGVANIEQARTGAKNQAENIQGANVATQTLGNLEQNLDALTKLNDDLPGPSVLPVSWKAEANKRNPWTDKAPSNAYEQFQEVNQQQVLNGLSELVKSGAIKGNQFVEKILSRGYAINPDATPEARLAEINNLRAELKNITARQQNVAGANNQYQPIPVKTGANQQQQPNQQPSTFKPNSIVKSKNGVAFVFMGGDPTDQKNYKPASGGASGNF